jgi:hypothetical protein
MDWNYSDRSRSSYAQALLTHGGWPVTDENRVALVAWMQAEGSKALNNPLATTQPYAGATDFNSAHVKNYKTLTDGIDATVKTLKNGKYPGIVAGLANGTSAETIASAVVASPWGTGPAVRALVPQVRSNPLKFDTEYARDPADAGDPGAVQDVTPFIPTLDQITDPLSAVASFLGLLTSWSTWRRILLLLAGAAAFILGIALMAGDSPTVRTAASDVAVAAAA